MNNGSCGLPLVSDVTVDVTDAAFTVVPTVVLSTCRVLPDGFENCRLLVPSAAFNCDTTELIPPVKFTPITCGLAPGWLGSGSAVGSSTRTICTCCWVPLFVNVRLMLLPGCRLLRSRLNPDCEPEVTAVPAVV